MKCENAMELLSGSPEHGAAEARRAATEHAAACHDCRAALAALHTLRTAALAAVPPPRAGAFERAIHAATRTPPVAANRRQTFWAGMGLGAALAAGIAFAIVMLGPVSRPDALSSAPQLSLAVNELRNVDIMVNSPETLADAEVHVVLSGPIGLSGYEGRRELRWRTDLEAGPNQLTLPVVATGDGNGQLLVEILHLGKRRTFIVDISARG